MAEERADRLYFYDGFEPKDSDMFIAVMGVTGVGKSTFISQLSDRPVKIGHNMDACKQSFETRFKAKSLVLSLNCLGTQQVEVFHCKYDAFSVYLVDTPGFDDTNRSDTEVLREIATWLTTSFSRRVQLDGIMYLHRITDTRLQGSARKNLSMFKKLCGADALKNVILTTTMWELVSPAEGERREEELTKTTDFWGYMVQNGSQVVRHQNTAVSARQLIRLYVSRKKALVGKKVTLEIQKEMVIEKKTLDDTAAGQEIDGEIAVERERLQIRLQQARKEMQKALEKKDQAKSKAVQQYQDEMKKQLDAAAQQQEQLKVSMENLFNQKNRQLQRMLNDQIQQTLDAERALGSAKVENQMTLLSKDKALQSKDSEIQKLKARSLPKNRADEQISLTLAGTSYYFCGPAQDY